MCFTIQLSSWNSSHTLWTVQSLLPAKASNLLLDYSVLTKSRTLQLSFLHLRLIIFVYKKLLKITATSPSLPNRISKEPLNSKSTYKLKEFNYN
jgi:hypothetical protein